MSDQNFHMSPDDFRRYGYAMVDWIAAADQPPRRVFVVHGEPEASAAFAGLVGERTGVEVQVPKYLEKVEF